MSKLKASGLFRATKEESFRPLFPQEGLGLGIARDTCQTTSKLHSHDFLEIAIVEAGTAIHAYEHATFNVKAGDVFVIHPHHEHQYTYTQDFSLINILFFDDGSIPLLSDLTQRPAYLAMFTLEPSLRQKKSGDRRLFLDYKHLWELLSLVGKYEKSLVNPEAFASAVATVHFLEIINYLCDAYNDIAPASGKKLTRLSAAISHADTHFREELRVEELAQLANMSLRSFQRNFRQTFSVSPVRYVLQHRIEEACRLLKQSNDGITQIAFKSGFKDPTYFSRVFHKEIGVTPKQYRQENTPRMPGE